jgi:ABC-2 type transport system permease protein
MSETDETQVSKSRMHGLWALTNRELKKWYQQPFVLAMGIIQPILWLALLGKAMNIGNIVTGIPGIDPTKIMMATFGTKDYFSFMSMSMVAFTVVFTTAFVGMSVVWDKRLGFMNKVLSYNPIKSTCGKRPSNLPSSHRSSSSIRIRTQHRKQLRMV